MNPLCSLSVREMAAGVRAKRWSAVEVVRAHAERIAERDSEVQAWAHVELEAALERAKGLDCTAPEGVLSGVPLAVKDIIDVAGMPTRYGSPIYASAEPARESAACVAALERAGALVLGKSVSTEFAYYSPGKTRNPWNSRHTPGGSSMGSAAAVACAMAAGALGTQTNGSIVRPAAFCGVVGFKPSFGIVANHGTLDPWPTLDHTGVFARDTGDAALLASVIAQPGAVSAAIPPLSQAPRIALVRTHVWPLAQRAQREALASAAAIFTGAGATVEEVELPPEFGDAHRLHRLIMAHEGARYFDRLQQRSRRLMSDALNALIDEGRAIAGAAYRETLKRAQALRTRYGEWITGRDFVLTPPAPGEAPATLAETGNPAFCTIWSLLGVPAITLPSGRGPEGLPLAIQLVGARGGDDRLLRAAAWCEARLRDLKRSDEEKAMRQG